MIYLKNLNGQVREYKDQNTKTVNALIDSGRWTRVEGLKDCTPYDESKKRTKKKTTKKKGSK